MKNGKYIQYSRIFHTFACVKTLPESPCPIMRCCLNLTIQAVPIHFLFAGQLSKTDTHKSINLFAWKRIHNNGYV